MQCSTVPARAKRAILVAATMAATLATTLVAPTSASAVTLPGHDDGDNRVCGTWVLQQVQSVAELNAYASKIDAALALPGVVGMSVRFPWKAVDTDFALLDRAAQMAAARGKQLSIRFMAGRHTPQRVFDAGAAYYNLASGEKVPAPVKADGSANTVFEQAWDEYVGRLAGWSRAHGVHLLHLAWYGQDWAELNNGVEVRASAGYTQQRWTDAHARLVAMGARHADASLSVEAPLSGYGPLSNGPSLALADAVTANVGADSSRMFVQANGWGPNGEWGAPSSAVEADFDRIWDRSVHRGLQMIQPQDYDWTAVFQRLYDVGASYAEVYLPSFAMPNATQLAAEVRRFSESRCAIWQTDSTPPTVSVTAPTAGAALAGTATVTVAASDDTAVTSTDLVVDGAVKSSTGSGGTVTFSWDTRSSGNGAHTIVARARDGAGNEATSTPVAVTVTNTVPTAPAELGVAAFRRTALVSWKAAATPDIAGYLVSLNGWPTTYVTGTSRWLSGLVPNTSYTVTIKAVDLTGNASWQAVSTFRTRR